MSDLIRSQVEENEEKIIKYQVMDNKNDDKIIRHQVMGIGGGADPVLESLTVSSNGTYTPEEGVDGYNEVNVNVTPQLESLTVTSNGTYTPGEGVDGYNEVNVNVESSTLPNKQLISNIEVVDGVIYDTVRNYNIDVANITINDNIMTVASNAGIYPMIGMSNNTPYLVEVDIDSIEEPTSDSRGMTLVNFSPRVNSDNCYIGYDNRSSATSKTWFTYGSSGYTYPSSPINYDYFDGHTMSIYFNVVYNENVTPYRWTLAGGLSGYQAHHFKVFLDDGTTELLDSGKSGNARENANLQIGRPSNSIIANITAIRVYLLNNLEFITE